MKRRDFLTIAAAFPLLACGAAGDGEQSGAPATADLANEADPSDALPIIVIGAGMAGLAAARTLVDAGRKVIVLEARARLGGRLHTSARWRDAPVDLGATWIHGDSGANPIASLAERIGARTATTSFDASLAFGSDGRRLNAAERAGVAALRDEIREAVSRIQDSSQEQSLADAIHGGTDYAERSAAEQAQIDYLINTTYEHEYGAAAGALSALWFDDDSRFDGDESLFLDGYRVLTDHLAQGIDVRLEHVVASIAYGEDAVAVTTERGVIHGQCAVVTLPLGVLQSDQVRFDPPLPAGKRQAIAQLGMGVLNKCFLRFESAFWDAQADWINYIPPGARPGQWAEWVSLARPTGQPILLGFNAAQFGVQIEAWSDAQIVADAMATLRTMFGNAIPDPIDWQITRWGADPFARGRLFIQQARLDTGDARRAGRQRRRDFAFCGRGDGEELLPDGPWRLSFRPTRCCQDSGTDRLAARMRGAAANKPCTSTDMSWRRLFAAACALNGMEAAGLDGSGALPLWRRC
jgi:monoamine oxidase